MPTGRSRRSRRRSATSPWSSRPTRRPRRCWPRSAPPAASCSTGAELFDVYTGEGIPAGTKSLAFALTYQAPDRTLGDKEIDKAHEKVEGRLRHVLKAQIRGKD